MEHVLSNGKQDRGEGSDILTIYFTTYSCVEFQCSASASLVLVAQLYVLLRLVVDTGHV